MASSANPGFITTQQAGMLRAPKLVGVAVYDSENKDIGKISDLLLDHDGSVKAVVLSIGGFLGIGSKDVAVPYSDIHWQTEQRTAATNPAPGATPGSTATGGMAANNAPAQKTVSPAKTEAYQGYPDRAVIDMSQAQLKAAPEFKYASNPEQVAPADSASGTTAPAQKD
jgi:sporulation protein YlmC with PRC-barrel domain